MRPVPVMFALLLFLSVIENCRSDDFETRMLQRFQQKNQSSAEKVRQELTEDLARAGSTGRDPAKLLDRLQQNLGRLHDDTYLPKPERLSLIEQTQDRMRTLKQVVAKLRPKAAMIPLDKTAKIFEPEPVLPPEQHRWRRVGQFSGGPTMRVTPVATADRRYVRINVAGVFGFSTISTTINVPDGGTAVLGGLATLSEGRSEFGPPLLSSIPVANRLFKNTSYGSQVKRTSFSASVRIISMEEEEARFLAGERP